MKLHITPLQKSALVALLLLCAAGTFAPAASAEELDLACSGNSYKHADPFPTPETFSLKIGEKNSVAIGGGSLHPGKVRVSSNNPIQLKFTAGKFTGEYFHLTGDLFLIHPDGRFMKLACKPS